MGAVDLGVLSSIMAEVDKIQEQKNEFASSEGCMHQSELQIRGVHWSGIQQPGYRSKQYDTIKNLFHLLADDCQTMLKLSFPDDSLFVVYCSTPE